jgi:hypothetical protein
MSYGALFKGKDNNVCFSENAPSTTFMGKAVNTGVYGATTYNRGVSYTLRYSNGNAHYIFENFNGIGSSTAGGITLQTNREIIADYGYGGGSSYKTRIDDNRLAKYTVESYRKPTIYTRYSNPNNSGGVVVKVEDSGTTGARGWSVWNIYVWLFYNTPGQWVSAANSMEFYCFSEMPANYTSSSTYGLVVKDAAGGTMFHSDFQPAKIQEIMEITTGTNPAIDFSSTLLDNSGATFQTMSKPAYLSQDWGRLIQYFGSGNKIWEHHQTPYSLSYVSGNNFQANFGNATLYKFGISGGADQFFGAPNIVFPIIDGADYD